MRSRRSISLRAQSRWIAGLAAWQFATGLTNVVLDWPLVWCYVLSSLVIIPMVLHGITFISRLQTWTQPLWVVLLLWPFAWFALAQPDFYVQFTGLSGLTSGSSDFEPLMFGAAVLSALLLRRQKHLLV